MWQIEFFFSFQFRSPPDISNLNYYLLPYLLIIIVISILKTKGNN